MVQNEKRFVWTLCEKEKQPFGGAPEKNKNKFKKKQQLKKNKLKGQPLAELKNNKFTKICTMPPDD